LNGVGKVREVRSEDGREQLNHRNSLANSKSNATTEGTPSTTRRGAVGFGIRKRRIACRRFPTSSPDKERPSLKTGHPDLW
jgi:hypothetical protein